VLRSEKLSGGDGVEITAQELFCLAFEFHEHDAVAELGMAGNDDSPDDDGAGVEPESGLNAGCEWELYEHLDVATAATEVGGYQPQGDVAAFLTEFDLDLDGVARIAAAVG
jgi:hypothetical protein